MQQLALVLTATTSLLLVANLGYAVSRDAGSRGALPMKAQQAIIEKLVPKRDVTQPPPSIDAEIWDAVVVPADNRMTPERVELGRKLYFEKRLSKDGTVACATHLPRREPRLYGSARDFGGHRWSARSAKFADHDERVSDGDDVSGRPRAKPGRTSQTTDRQPD